jgi:transposase InsO family protein
MQGGIRESTGRSSAVLWIRYAAGAQRNAFHGERLTRFQQMLHSADIEHRLIRPRSPASNGKVERFIKTIDDECFA